MQECDFSLESGNGCVTTALHTVLGRFEDQLGPGGL